MDIFFVPQKSEKVGAFSGAYNFLATERYCPGFAYPSEVEAKSIAAFIRELSRVASTGIIAEETSDSEQDVSPTSQLDVSTRLNWIARQDRGIV